MHYLIHVYKVCHKSIEIEAVFTKIEMNNEWNINFFRIQSVSKIQKISILFWHILYISILIVSYFINSDQLLNVKNGIKGLKETEKQKHSIHSSFLSW